VGELTLDHLSYSSVSTYSDCGEKFRLRKRKDIRRPPSWAAMGGRGYHKATEILDFADFGMGSTYYTNDAKGHHELFQDCFDAEIAEAEQSGVPREEWYVGGRQSKEWPDKENEKWWRHHGPGFVTAWRGWLQRSGWSIYLPPGGEPAIEIAYEVMIGGFAAVGYIDRVMESQGQLMIVDLKTGREPHGHDQLRDYGVGLSRSVGWTSPTPEWGSFFLARQGGCTPPVRLVPEDGELRDHVYRVALAGIRADVFLPNRGSMCKSCDVKDYCISWTGRMS
jgi:hypothetical protein